MCLNPILLHTSRPSYVTADGLMVKQINPLYVSCGKCPECEDVKSREWAYRCMDEMSIYGEQNCCMLTLTYADTDGELCKRDLQLFLKRLRKKYSFRYFGCGEYGDKFGRPHFHLIMFGYRPNDMKFFFKRKGHNVYKSEEVSRVWGKGFISVEEVTFESCKYCSLYFQKTLSSYREIEAIPEKRIKPFRVMSRRPGIGFLALQPYWFKYGYRYIKGKRVSLPKIYLNWGLKLGYRNEVRIIKNRRLISVNSLDNLHKRLTNYQKYKKFIPFIDKLFPFLYTKLKVDYCCEVRNVS